MRSPSSLAAAQPWATAVALSIRATSTSFRAMSGLVSAVVIGARSA